MKVIAARPEWLPKFHNLPTIKVMVETYPDGDLLRYEKRGPLYFAEREGYVRFYGYTGPGEGYGGRVFKITMADGTKKELKGPFSSSPCAMHGAGFTPCVDVSLTDEEKVWKVGHTFFGAYLTVDFVKEFVMPLMDGIHLIEFNFHGTPMWVPSVKEDRVVKPHCSSHGLKEPDELLDMGTGRGDGENRVIPFDLSSEQMGLM